MILQRTLWPAYWTQIGPKLVGHGSLQFSFCKTLSGFTVISGSPTTRPVSFTWRFPQARFPVLILNARMDWRFMCKYGKRPDRLILVGRPTGSGSTHFPQYCA